nr:class II aldolase/adducin family protein [uncultured Oscillibacter sp.]
MAQDRRKALAIISQYAGMREDIVQAGGGNTSVKDGLKRMYIKASGYQLTEVTEAQGFSVVDPSVIANFFHTTPLEQITKADEGRLLADSLIAGKRPSIETFLHAITGEFTIHSHSLPVTVLAARQGGMERLGAIVPEALLVPYATPGIDLAKAFVAAWKERDDGEPVQAAFFQNHGLLVSAGTAEEAIAIHENILARVNHALGMNSAPWMACTALWKALCSVSVCDRIVCLMQDRRIYNAYHTLGRLWDHALSPDCVVYCGKRILLLPENYTAEDIRPFVEQYGPPSVILFQGGFYAIAPTVRKAKEVESLFAFSAEAAVWGGGRDVCPLPDGERDLLLDWDAEKYRKTMR